MPSSRAEEGSLASHTSTVEGGKTRHGSRSIAELSPITASNEKRVGDGLGIGIGARSLGAVTLEGAVSMPTFAWLATCDAPRGGVCARRALGKTKCGATVNDGPANGDEAEPEILGPA